MAAWAAVAVKKPWFQTNDTPGYDNCTTVKAFAAAHRNFGGPICSNGSSIIP